MEYFAGLDVSMEETHICILDREGVLIREGKHHRRLKRSPRFSPSGPHVPRLCLRPGGWPQCFSMA